MIEGGGSPTLSKAKAWLYQHQESSHQLLQAITDVCVDYLVGQVLAGAQMLQVFESNAGLLGRGLFMEFSFPYLQQIAHKVKERLLAKYITPVPMVSKINTQLTNGMNSTAISWRNHVTQSCCPFT